MSFIEIEDALDAPIPKSTHSIWCEKYRPSSLSGYIGNESLKHKIRQYIDTNDIPHLLFFGGAGTGKCLDFSEKVRIRMKLSPEEVKKMKRWIV